MIDNNQEVIIGEGAIKSLKDKIERLIAGQNQLNIEVGRIKGFSNKK